MNSCEEKSFKRKEYIFNEYNLHKYENKVNKWLDRTVETNNSVLSLTNEDVVEEFYEEILSILGKQKHIIYNVNSFKDDIIRFLYKHSDGGR